MKFVNKEHFDAFLNCLSFLGQGSQGICYLDSKNRIVYKVLHEYFDEDENIYFSKEQKRYTIAYLISSYLIFYNNEKFLGSHFLGSHVFDNEIEEVAAFA